MRLVSTFKDKSKAETFSHFLSAQGIENQLEPSENNTFYIWVVDEDQYENAAHWHALFESDRENPVFKKLLPPSPQPFLFEKTPEEPLLKTKNATARSPITYGIVMICALLFLSSGLSIPSIQKIPKNVPISPILMAPTAKTLLYDYPKAWEYIDTLIDRYGINALESPQKLPSEGKLLLYKFYNTPYWQGAYEIVVGKIKNGEGYESLGAPLFEKIKEGEFWRAFTPCLLHFDIFHIFFNMIWLILLGRQIEYKIGGLKYILFIILTALISNTAQYLMSGPNFIGFSGVVLAMIGFIYTRQSTAAWEGYQLTRSTFLFVMIFIGSILLLQLISFLIDITGYITFTPPIANTAHIVGFISGYFLGKLSFFSWKF